jgi:hypothetical protein
MRSQAPNGLAIGDLDILSRSAIGLRFQSALLRVRSNADQLLLASDGRPAAPSADVGLRIHSRDRINFTTTKSDRRWEYWKRRLSLSIRRKGGAAYQ